ncbi:MAG: 3-beta hydroxysteroid dehydrogenase, partial [Microcystis panniformis]
MTRQVLITGGAGFVGSSLGLGLAQLYPDWKIIALDNLKRRGSELNI